MSELRYNQNLNSFLTSTLPEETKLAFIDLVELLIEGRNDIIAFSEKILDVPLNNFQKKFLSHTTTLRSLWGKLFGTIIEEIGGMIFGRNIACPGNQIGKTVMIAIKHIWMNFYKIGLDLDESLMDKAYYATLNISPHSRQVKQCFNYVKEILEGRFIIDEDGKKRINTLSPLIKDFIVGDNVNLGEIRLRNKGIFYSVPTGQDQAASLAGGQFAYISYDECAQSYHLEAELGAKIMSRLIKYGVCLDLISTAEVDSPSHQFYLHLVKMGLQGLDGLWALPGKLDDNIFISSEQRERIKADLLKTDKKRYRQVVFGEFISGGKRYFQPAEIEQLWSLSGKIACQKKHLYLLVADWGMADTGADSVFKVLDYTNFPLGGKIQIVNHEKIKGGSPEMQFALLRTLYDSYTWYDDDGTTAHYPIFLMDAESLGGVVIKKLLVKLSPKAFGVEKDEALFILKKEMSAGREFEESEVDGAIIEKNPNFGNISSYYIDELASQMGIYHIEDKKLTKDFVMTLMMGIAYIVKKIPKVIKRAEMSLLAGYGATINQTKRRVINTNNLFK